MLKLIKPELPGGVKDYLPSAMIAREQMLATIKQIYESFGFVPLGTPAIEKLETLTGNDPSFNMNLFHAKIVQGPKAETLKYEGSDMALRFDHTVPLARIMAQYPHDLPKPFKRYAVGPVWRGEKPQAGRFREFWQFDADIVGSNSILADTEIVQIIYQIMKALGFQDFVIRINNRKILNRLAEIANFGEAEKKEGVFRILDALEKLPREEIKNLLLEILNPDQAKKVLDFCRAETLEDAESILGSNRGTDELREISQNLETLEVANWKIDLSIARGLGYYTGPVFETNLPNWKKGSVYSGGRFDGLSNRFAPDSNIPAVGASVGVDRLFVAMQDLGMIKNKLTSTQVLIALFDKNLIPEYLKLAQELRSAGIRTELYPDQESFRTQIAYTAKQEIPILMIMGSDEKSTGKVTIRDMRTRRQKTVNKSEILAMINKQLAH